jgi:hypothetical protein
MIVMVKAAFNKKDILFTSKLDLYSRKKLVKCYIWNKASGLQWQKQHSARGPFSPANWT